MTATPSAAPSSDDPKAREARARERVDALLARAPVVRDGTFRSATRSLSYAMRMEFLPVAPSTFELPDHEADAAIFTTSYVTKETDASTRPVCFAFNGGPGSSSIWLHMGALGPKRVPIHEDGTMPPPPYHLVDNPHSWLEHFDLVFVDPPHTGFSITASKAARKKMLSTDGDVAALTDVIRAWIDRHQRWNSPIYVAGESYGTTRGAAIADLLLDHGIALSGLILVSCAMDIQSIEFAPKNDLPYALFLPAFAGTAQFHGKLTGAHGATPEAARAAAEEFVVEDYLPALHLGARLGEKQRRRIARRVAELTGLRPAFVDEKNLRITDQEFFFELLREDGLLVGRLESRVTGPMAASRVRTWEFDPGLEALIAPYAMAARAYLREGGGLELPNRYLPMSDDVHKKWNWNRGEAKGNNFTSTSGDLARAMRRNRHLRVLVASGYYDLGTPYSATDWSLAQIDAPAATLARITHRYYDAGHMMYTRESELTKLEADLKAWLAAPA